MTTKPGEVYRVDLGVGGKVRLMVVVSRQDAEAPRALSLCVPITTAFRESAYEVELSGAPYLTQKSYELGEPTSRVERTRGHDLWPSVG